MPTGDLGTTQSSTIIDILLSERLLTPAQVDEIKVKSASLGLPYEEVLKNMNVVPPAKIAEAKAKLLGIPFISLSSASFSPLVIGMIPKAVAERFLLIPFLFDEETRTLSVAMSNPVDLEALEFVRQKTGLNLKTFATSVEDIKNAISQQYRQEIVGEVGEAVRETEELF